MNNTDLFDELINLEESFYKQGVKEGEDNSIHIGHFQGRLHGFENGFELGKKIGFYKGLCELILVFNRRVPNPIPKRVIKPTLALLQLIEAIPDFNDKEMDFEAGVIAIQTKAKLLLKLLGFSTDFTPTYRNKPDLSY